MNDNFSQIQAQGVNHQFTNSLFTFCKQLIYSKIHDLKIKKWITKHLLSNFLLQNYISSLPLGRENWWGVLKKIGEVIMGFSSSFSYWIFASFRELAIYPLSVLINPHFVFDLESSTNIQQYLRAPFTANNRI